MTRINKFLAECGVASRRAAEEFIRNGKVKVNGEIISDLSFKITDADEVFVNGKQIIRQPEKVYVLLNKPAGVVTTCSDQFDRKTVIDIIASGSAIFNKTKQSLPENLRLFPVGRLDYATEGLLILTNDGEFARRLTHPSSEIPKTYVATLNKSITNEQLNQLRTGVGYNAPKHVSASGQTVKITITEGRNRQVRKMVEAIGLQVKYLQRISIGSLTLGELKTGEWRFLTAEEIVCFF